MTANELREKFLVSFSASQVKILNKALDFADKVHYGQVRASGEPYIIHPIEVANILIDIGLDYNTIAAALLHDTIEDTTATESDLYSIFGEEVTSLVLGVTKLEKYTYMSREEAQAENFRRMFFAMARDIRVLLIKIADRLHNMRTIGSKPLDRQKAIATETLEIYAPLASRLGLSYFKCELEDLSLKVLEPQMYDKLTHEIALKRAERQELVNLICNRLGEMLDELKIKGEISGRPKHFYSIYRKMVYQNKTFEQIYDLIAVRVIVTSIKDCYEVLGMIHSLWKPIPGRFKDYISVPKPNNYQSLHTTVMTSYGMPFEIQIRTYEMHRIAEYGIAAHWLYKENRTTNEKLDANVQWLRGIMDEQADSTTSREFYESLKFDFKSSEVFVFTPKGDAVPLPEGSTPIDFAYYVHTEVGNRCVGAKINSKIVPLSTQLQTGDYVEILTSPNSKGPSRDWLRIVCSSQAKNKIRAFFKKEMKDENIKDGRRILETEASNRGYNLDDLLQKKWLDVIMQRYQLSSIEDLYASIAYGGFSVNQILSKLIDFYRKENNLKKINQRRSTYKNDNDCGVVVMGHNDLLVHIARCCNPVPGDDICGFISRGRGIAIHRKNCPNIKGLNDVRIVEAHWSDNTKSSFSVALQIETKNTAGLLAKITQIISDMHVFIDNLNARTDKHNASIINLSIRVKSIAEFETIRDKIKMIPEVDKVFRCQ